jgi:hypothetical protein
MKKMLFAIVLAACPCTLMMGCGGPTGNTVVEGDLEAGQESMSTNQMDEYQKAMESGAGSSSADAPGN